MLSTDYWSRFALVHENWYNFVFLFSVFIGFVGLVLNIFVIYYLIKVKCQRGYSEKYFLINLAVSDLLKIVFNLPLKAISSAYRSWIFGDIGCQIYGFTGALFGFMSITTMALMTIERFLVIKNPLNALKNRNKMVIGGILFSWIYSFFWAALQFAWNKKYVLEGILTSCTFDYLSEDIVSRLIIMAMFVGGFLVPFTLIITFYILLLNLLRLKNPSLKYTFDSMRQKQMSVQYVSSLSELRSRNNTHRRSFSECHVVQIKKTSSIRRLVTGCNRNVVPAENNVFIRREAQVTRTIALCVGFFCFTWFPYMVVVLIGQFVSQPEQYITPLSATLPALFAKCSIILNPLIYTLTNIQCKLYLKKLFSSVRIEITYNNRQSASTRV